jgi:hypothetical protein
VNYGRLASAFSPLVAAVLDPRTQPQHAQLLQEMAGEIGALDGVFTKQKQFQAIHKLTHLKGPYDRVSSVIIPGILLATCFTLVVYDPILLWCIWCFLWSCPHSLTLLFVSVLD